MKSLSAANMSLQPGVDTPIRIYKATGLREQMQEMGENVKATGSNREAPKAEASQPRD